MPKVLDHGYVELVEAWGSDERIIEAARMSTGKGFLGWGPHPCSNCGHIKGEERGEDCCPDGDMHDYPYGDERLLRYLYENKHSTPFEMGGLVIEVQAPIFVFREWHRHRTQSYNELSARYTPLPNANYMPTAERCFGVLGQAGHPQNKQAQGHRKRPGELTHEEVLHWLEALDNAYRVAQAAYELGLEIGIPKEVARCPVPVARYSRMRASTNLRNWLAFMTLRSDKNMNAQWEIRQFANALSPILAKKFPRTMHLFEET